MTCCFCFMFHTCWLPVTSRIGPFFSFFWGGIHIVRFISPSPCAELICSELVLIIYSKLERWGVSDFCLYDSSSVSSSSPPVLLYFFLTDFFIWILHRLSFHLFGSLTLSVCLGHPPLLLLFYLVFKLIYCIQILLYFPTVLWRKRIYFFTSVSVSVIHQLIGTDTFSNSVYCVEKVRGFLWSNGAFTPNRFGLGQTISCLLLRKVCFVLAV